MLDNMLDNIMISDKCSKKANGGYVFDAEEIQEFCLATEDSNALHDPEKMHGLGKKVIVPGMLIFSSTAYIASKYLESKANYLRAIFNSPLSENEEFRQFLVWTDSDNEITLGAETKEKSLLSKEQIKIPASGLANYSFENALLKKNLYKKNDWYSCMRSYHHGSKAYRCEVANTFNFQGAKREYKIDIKKVLAFGNMISKGEKKNPDAELLLYSIAYSSHVLLESVIDPFPEERALAESFGGPKKILPVYESLEIYFKHPGIKVNPDAALEFTTSITRKGEGEKDRDYIANVRCDQRQGPKQTSKGVYAARYKLTAVPEALILRGLAKKL